MVYIYDHRVLGLEFDPFKGRGLGPGGCQSLFQAQTLCQGHFQSCPDGRFGAPDDLWVVRGN
jgi:hypothetical protein